MVSVCIAAHNGEKYIGEQLESILNQLSDRDEIIISDDGSEDNTLAIVQSFNDKRIKIFRKRQDKVNGKHKGFYYSTSNFENALNHAGGDFIFLCDQDDVWYEDKLKVCIDALDDCDYIKHDYSTIDGNGSLKTVSNYKASDYIHWNFFWCMKTLPFRGCCMAFRRKVIDASLPFPAECLQHDSWIGMNAVLNGFSFKYIDKPLLYHRIHESNLSELKNKNSLMFRIKYRLVLLSQLGLRKSKSLLKTK